MFPTVVLGCEADILFFHFSKWPGRGSALAYTANGKDSYREHPVECDDGTREPPSQSRPCAHGCR